MFLKVTCTKLFLVLIYIFKFIFFGNHFWLIYDFQLNTCTLLTTKKLGSFKYLN